MQTEFKDIRQFLSSGSIQPKVRPFQLQSQAKNALEARVQLHKNPHYFFHGEAYARNFVTVLKTFDTQTHLPVQLHQDFNCIIFHDVDFIPEDDRIMYRCSNKGPRLLASSVTDLNLKKHFVFYPEYLGQTLIVSFL